MNKGRMGTTLVELIVVLALLGFVIALVVPAMTALPERSDRLGGVDSLRLLAIGSGRPATLAATDSTPAALALPDGRLLLGAKPHAQ